MAIEIEKKYRLTNKQRDQALQRVRDIGASFEREDFEVNVLYGGNGIDLRKTVLRLRRFGDHAKLTYKERMPSSSAIKRQREEETEVGNAETTDAILRSLGFKPALIYEKRRIRWRLGEAVIVIDDLPFGRFMEIEAPPGVIRRVEKLLGIEGLQPELKSYPLLTSEHGKRNGELVEARFSNETKTAKSASRPRK